MGEFVSFQIFNCAKENFVQIFCPKLFVICNISFFSNQKISIFYYFTKEPLSKCAFVYRQFYCCQICYLEIDFAKDFFSYEISSFFIIIFFFFRKGMLIPRTTFFLHKVNLSEHNLYSEKIVKTIPRRTIFSIN